MAWIKSYQALRHHPKTSKLARRVGSVPCAVGLLHCLWWWTLDYAPDGDLSRFTDEDIAVACAWDDAPEDIVRHLVECGFLDRSDAELTVHDWWEYGESLLLQRQAHRDRSKTQYERSKEHSSDSMRADCAHSAGRERKKEREKERTACAGASGGSTPPAHAEEEGTHTVKELADQVLKAVGA